MSATLDDGLLQWLQLIESEYFEMPGLHLTREQIQRMWGLDRQSCELVLGALEARKVLARTRDDAYVRADRGC